MFVNRYASSSLMFEAPSSEMPSVKFLPCRWVIKCHVHTLQKGRKCSTHHSYYKSYVVHPCSICLYYDLKALPFATNFLTFFMSNFQNCGSLLNYPGWRNTACSSFCNQDCIIIVPLLVVSTIYIFKYKINY
jgi:hypothetical protein